MRRRTFLAAALAGAGAALAGGCAPSGPGVTADTVRVGMLHSLSGTMAISEVTVRDAVLLAVERVNAAGGVLGRRIEPVVEDGASDEVTFADKARKLLMSDRVAAVFGGWTSASRKAMLPVFEAEDGLLFYPVQYEGMESSPNIVYTGATTNQQIVPALDHLRDQGHTRIHLVGSDYVFPRTANRVIAAYAKAHGIEITGTDYTPLGHTEYTTVTAKIARARPDAVFNTLNGDSNVAFFKQLRSSGITADDMPVLSVSVAEEEVGGIGPEILDGHLVAWNYFQTTDTPENRDFVAAFQDEYGARRVTSDPMQSAYNAVHLWAAAAEAAGDFDTGAVREAAAGLTIDAPEGPITFDAESQHLAKTARIGRIGGDGSITEVADSGGPITPDPYLSGYDWAAPIRP
ncbi:urea ABC transporter substrate-binding protein [Nocardiopsis sp. RSe5-2]|uniref:Urea ABC transporter substrate-binding protein n=1 Tax=Nocardiopsis endophytica TaxID=3018445 RepID=A0ABT4TZ84_9ACTN|nr:urea ABC transporter substrate-binding protein [Nocardiopsis endophytica]MDA2809721.1 urea ABC transporter substrate-binding protein [Nocardiopsis endophytica]